MTTERILFNIDSILPRGAPQAKGGLRRRAVAASNTFLCKRSTGKRGRGPRVRGAPVRYAVFVGHANVDTASDASLCK